GSYVQVVLESASRGGAGSRKFYFSEVDRIETRDKSRFPPTNLTAEEINAGFQNIANAFGFYGTLLYMESETGHRREELLKWSVNEFRYNLIYLSHCQKANKEYYRIMNDEMKKKK